MLHIKLFEKIFYKQERIGNMKRPVDPKDFQKFSTKLLKSI